MPDQKTVDDAINESLAAERRTGRPGRPKGEPTRMTTVNLPPELHAPAPDLCAKIEKWLDRIEIQELAKFAAQRALNIAIRDGNYDPVAFRVDIEGLWVAMRGASRGDDGFAADSQEKLKELKKSFRIPQSLYNRIDMAALRLATNRSEIIRLALIDAFPRGGKELLDLDQEFPTLGLPRRQRALR